MYHICFSCDDQYYIPAMITIESLLKNNSEFSKDIVFHTFFGSLNEEHMNALRTLLEKYDSRLELVQTSDEFEEAISKMPITLDYISIKTFYRLLFPFIMTDVDRCLYIDCDIMVRGNIEGIFQFQDENKVLRAVTDLGCGYFAGKLGLSEYYNAGILMMNLDKIRSLYTFENFIVKMIGAYDIYDITMADQDLINIIFAGDIEEINEKYNCQDHMGAISSVINRKKLKEAIIIHFVTEKKPWLANYSSIVCFEYYGYLKKYILRHERIHYWTGKLTHVIHSSWRKFFRITSD